MRALQAGLGRARAAAPPALYAFDPDTGRLAVTTPRYSTAIVAVNHRAFPYGGLDIARLVGADGEVIGTLGGTGTAGFGLRVGTQRTQYGRRGYAPGPAPLRLVHAPGARPRELRADGASRAGAARRVRARPAGGGAAGGRARRRRAARVRRAVLRPAGAGQRSGGDGRVPVHADRDRGALDGACAGWGGDVPELGSPHAGSGDPARGTYAIGSGYTVTVRGARSTRIVRPRPQNANPDPGPTLEVALAGTELSARLVPR